MRKKKKNQSSNKFEISFLSLARKCGSEFRRNWFPENTTNWSIWWNKNIISPYVQRKCELQILPGKWRAEKERRRERPRRSFSRRLSSTRTGSEPCIRVMMSSTSEPARGIPAEELVFLRALNDAEAVSPAGFVGGCSWSPLLMWAVALAIGGAGEKDPLLPCSHNTPWALKYKNRELHRERDWERVYNLLCSQC